LQDKVFEFKNAVFLGLHENGSPEWHELRKGAVGGSQVGTILGVNPWESAVTAFYKATGAIDDHIKPSMSMRLGTKLEDDILEVFSEEHPELEIFTTGTYASYKAPWQHANPDGIYRKADGTLGVIEIKFSRDYWSEVPPSYRKQVLWYLHVLGLDEAYIVALAGSAYQEFTIVRDQFEIDAMVQAVERFYECVQNNVQPDWDGSGINL
jgi:putative phage-type endonuclease